MTPAQLAVVEEIFHEALGCNPDQLNPFLDKACGNDDVLRHKVEQLLAAHAQAGTFIETPVAPSVKSLADEPLADLLIGQTLGLYIILSRFSSGGMGAVYLAERADQQYQKQVAIKLIKRGMDTDSVLRHFRNERQILANFDHSNIARLLDGGATRDGLPYFVMEHVEGVPIDKYCDARGLSITERLKLFCEVCAAVTYAHDHGVVHRDIKPSNILVTSDGRPKLLDFGIAKALQQSHGVEATETVTFARPMTPEYASPEQLRGERVTPASDIYSLGIVLYQLLTGQQPYRLKTRTPEEISRVMAQEPTRPSTANASRVGSSKLQIPNPKLLRGDLDNIVLMALRKDPERRYQSVEQLCEDIRNHLEGRPVVARPVLPLARVWRWSRRNPLLAGAATASLLLAFAVVWLLREQFNSRATPAPEKSIAVLPFEYLGADKSDAYVSDGIQEEILTRLSKIADLKVISRTSTQRYKSKPENLPTIAKQLGVAHILEGSVQKNGDAMRVNVQLINARSDSHLWAENYDRKLSDIFAVETEIATKVADTLQAKLTGHEQRAIAAQPTQNSEAHQLYLQGRHLWGQRTDTALLKAIDYFNHALSLDPNYARAYAGIADCYIALPYYSKLNPAECLQKAKPATSKALEIDNNLAEAHVALAVLLIDDGKVEEARNEFLRAMQLDPNYANAPHWYALNYLLPLGQFDEAITQFKRALELDPLSASINANLGETYVMARRYPEAIAQLRKTIELNPASFLGYGVLGYAFDVSGQFDEAIAEYQKSYELSRDFHALALLGHAYARKGDREKALQLLKQLQDLEQQGSVWNFGFAALYLALGDKNEALNRLEQSYRAGEAGDVLLRIRVDPLLDPLRGDPRFEKLANKIIPPEPVTERASKSSIAVLPFENLSRDPDNAFFTIGVQDEILTALARIADLKVISRTSVMEYKSGIARDLREISEQLGVAHVLEGSVQRSGNHARVNVQLVDARSDAHLWAQTYDRELADVFSIQTDIAKAIATQLQTKLSASEQSAIAQPPTTDLAAFLLYNRAKSLLVLTTMSTGAEHKFRQAIDLLNQAVARDPSFFLAYCQLAHFHDQLYYLGIDHTSARLALAKAAVQAAFRLRPDAGEAHLAHSENLFRGDLDYDGALAELDIAHQTLPNDPRIFELAGYIQSRQGKFEEALRSRERALELDPRNLFAAQKVAITNGLLRRYAKEATVLDRCLAIDPNDIDTRVARARLDLEWKADPRPLHNFIDTTRTENSTALPTIADSWFACALAERDAAAGKTALESLGDNTFGNDTVQLSRNFGEGLIARMTNDEAKARAAFGTARSEQEKRVRAQPNYGPALCILGLIDAGLGRKEDALREGRRAIELLPVEKDAINGVHMIEYFAIIAAWVGEKDLACEQLTTATRLPGYLSYGQLKLLPFWDPLRGDPRFEKIVASLAPK